jgi:hypothetical protein
LKNSETVTVLPADKGNVALVLGTADYNRKTAVLLEDQKNSLQLNNHHDALQLPV